MRATRTSAVLLLLCMLLGLACGPRRITARVPVAKPGTTEEGIASWYGEPYHGRRAANGEIYDMQSFTAAHPTLPFETWVRVRLLATSKQTEVRIIDRGPFAKGRIIDLSRAAADAIDLVRPGTAKVRLTVIDPPKSYTRNHQFTVQVSSLPRKDKAEQLRKQLAPSFANVAVRYRAPNAKGGHDESWRVLVGRETKLEDARKLQAQLLPRFPNCWIVPWDVE